MDALIQTAETTVTIRLRRCVWATRLGAALLAMTGLAAAGEPDPFDDLKQYDFGADRSCLTAIENQVHAAFENPAAAAALEARLLAVLQTDASFAAKQFVCRQLRLIGSTRAMPALSPLLADARLSHMARAVLEAVPGPLAAGALRGALRETRGFTLIGIINSLGERHDRANTEPLVALLRNRDPAVMNAAISALGKTGGDQALDHLRAVAGALEPSLAEGVRARVELEPQTRFRIDLSALADALLRGAESVAREGRTASALDLCARLGRASLFPVPNRTAAFLTLVRLDTRQAAPTIMSLLRGNDAALWPVAGDLLRQTPPEALEQVLLLLDALPAAPHVIALSALAERGEPIALPPLLRATRSPDDTVKAAAARALARYEGSAETVVRLAELAATSTDTPARAAREALRRLRGPAVDPALITALRHADPAVRAESIRAAGVRGLTNALPAATEALVAHEASLRVAALEALARLAGPAQQSVLLERLLQAATPAEDRAAAVALVAVSRQMPDDERRVGLLVAGLPEAKPEAARRVLACLGQIAGAAALSEVGHLAREGTPAMKDQAIAVLAAWPDATAMDELIAVAKGADKVAHHTLALRGFIGLIGRPNTRSPAQTVSLFEQALGLALTDDEKQEVLADLASVRHPAALSLLDPLLDNPLLREAAARAMLQIARVLGPSAPAEARSVILRVQDSAPGESVAAEARQAAEQLDRPVK